MAQDRIEIRITANDSASRVFKSFEGRIVALNQALELTTRIGRSIGQAIGAVVDVSNRFEAAMNQVQGLTQSTERQFKSLREQALSLGESTQFSASQAAEGMGFLAQAGFETQKILAAMPATLQLAASANLSLASAADTVSNVMQGYGLAASETTRATNVLTKAFTTSNTNLSQLGQAMKFAGPVAKGMGIEFEETAAAIGLMGNAGIQASMAGTALRGALTRLANPSKENAELIEQLGLNVLDAEGNMRPLVDIVGQLEESGASTAEVMQIFGQRAGPAMQALVDQGSDSLARFTDKLRDSEGTAARMAETRMRGLPGALRELQSGWEALLLAFGDAGLIDATEDVIRTLTGALRSMGQWIRENQDTVQALFDTFTDPIMVGAIAAVGAAVAALLSPLAAVALAITGAAGLVAAFVIFKDDVLRLVEETVEGVRTWIGDRLTAVLEGLREPVDAVIGMFRDMWQQVVGGSFVPDMVEGVTEDFEFMALEMERQAERGTQATEAAFSEMEQRVLGHMLRTQAGMRETLAVEQDVMAQRLSLATGFWENLNNIAEAAGQRQASSIKALATVTALIKAYQAYNMALASLPFPFNLAAAGATLAQGLAQVQRIRSTPLPSFHTGSGVLGSGDLVRLPGMAPDEGAAVLQTGERVQSREEVAAGGGGDVHLEVHLFENATHADAMLRMSRADWRQVLTERLIPALDDVARLGIRPRFVANNT